MIKVQNKKISEDGPCFIIAEIGVNHNGNKKLAKKLIDNASRAGADAVKFQLFKAEKLITKNAEKAKYQKETTNSGESQYEMLKKLELQNEDFIYLSQYANNKNIVFLSSAFDYESIDFLDKLNVPAYKIPSGELTNLPLLKYIANKKKPIILSTGMSTIVEIDKALNTLRQKGTDDIALMHCVSNYPTDIKDVNLRAIGTLKEKFNVPIGFSDHTLGITISFAAVAYGACIIEKHITLDKKLPGPDHKASIEPKELKKMVNGIREIEMAMGNGEKIPNFEEEKIKKLVRKSIVSSKKIPKGTLINESMISIKRPGTGISPEYFEKIIGKRTLVDIEEDELITWEKIE